MSLLYNGNKEKRDPKEFKKLLADLESRRKKGVVPAKKQQVEELNSKNEENAISSLPESSTEGIVSKEDSSNFDIQSPEETETQYPLSVQEKIQDSKKQQVEELNSFKSDINSELAKQNKGISDIEDDLERMEQKMFHSQGGDKTSRDDVSEYSSNEEYTEGFNLQGIKNLFTDQASEKTSNWIAGLAAGGQALWNYAKDGLFGDDKEESKETKEPKINVPPSPNDPDYEYKKKLYAKQHPESQDPESQKQLEIQKAKEVQKSPENKLPPIEQKNAQDTPKEQKTTRVMSTVQYYREVINDPRSSKLQVAEAKLKLANHIQAQKNLIDMAGWESADEEDKRHGQEAQAYLDAQGDLSDIDMNFDKLRDDVEQEKANTKFKKKRLTKKEELSWWEKLIGRKETEKLDPKLKKQIEDEELDIVEVRAIYNNVKNNPILNIEDKKFLETKIAGYEASLAQAAGEDLDNKTSSTESQSKGKVSSAKINTEVSDVVEKSVEKADKIEKETKDNIKKVSNVDLVDEKKVSDVIKVEKENAPDPEIQSTATTTQGQNLGAMPDSSPSPSGAPAGGGGGAGNNSENNKNDSSSTGSAAGGGGATETAGNNLEKKEVDTVASDGTSAPVGGSSEINSTNGNITNSGSSPESKVTPNQDSKELAKQTSPEVKPDIVENVNNQKEIQTYYQKKGNFEQYDNANLNEKAKKVLGTV